MSSRYGLEIRAATAADAPGLAELFATAGLAVSPPLMAERLDALRGAPGVALIAEAWGPPTGLVVLHWLATLHTALPTAHVSFLLVASDERRRGVGRLLLKAASQAARQAGCGALHLSAPIDQPTLRAFCTATGFTEHGADLVRPLRKQG